MIQARRAPPSAKRRVSRRVRCPAAPAIASDHRENARYVPSPRASFDGIRPSACRRAPRSSLRSPYTSTYRVEMISKAISTCVLSALALGACSHAPPPPVPQPKTLGFVAIADSIVYRGLPDVHWGIEIWDQGRNRLLYGHDSPRKHIPASNTKLVVTTTAMALLGPDWRYNTRFGLMGSDTAPRALVV